MFGIFQSQKNAIAEDNRSDETSARDDLAKALIEAAPQAETNQKTQLPGNGHTPFAVGGGAKPPSTPNPDSKINQEAVTALNVKVVCDLAGLLPDKGNYEITRGQAIGMALSIENGPCRHFAVDHVVGLCRRRGDLHVAKQLLDQVTDNALREHILKICPELRHPNLVMPRHT
jgi:hypothetical protein